MIEPIEEVEEETLEEEELEPVDLKEVTPGWWWIRYQDNPFTQAQVEERGEPVVGYRAGNQRKGRGQPYHVLASQIDSVGPVSGLDVFLDKLRRVEVAGEDQRMIRLSVEQVHRCQGEGGIMDLAERRSFGDQVAGAGILK